MSLKRKIYGILALVCIVMLCSWGIFYLKTAQEMQQTSENYISQVSDRVIDTMESTLLGLEHVAVALSSSPDAKGLLLEKNPLAYHEKAGEVRQVLDSIYQPDGLADEILIYDMEGIYCRLRGKLGNTAANRVQFLVEENKLSQHMVVTLEGNSYIGYITGIFQEEEQLGYLVFLMKGSRMQDLFLRYDGEKSLAIGLVADKTVVAANDDKLLGARFADFQGNSRTVSVRQIGLTPFQVLVADNGETIHKTMSSFFFAATMTILLILALILIFYYFLSKLFFRPMIGLMEDAKLIGATDGLEKLQPTGQAEFDQLVEQVNSMIFRLEENSRTLYEMQYKMQNTELEKQRAIIISLKKQINAHFTVNTLNVIRRLNETSQSDKVGEMCNGLSSMLRYANGAEEFIGGLEEMRILEQYVDIMSIRYPERFTATFEVDDQLDDMVLPRMLLQPIIENAIVHGLLPKEKGHLRVWARVDGETMLFSICDNGRGMETTALEVLREKIYTAPSYPWDESGIEHIALPNIQKRVVSMAGEGYGLMVESELGKGTLVTLRLPAYIPVETLT